MDSANCGPSNALTNLSKHAQRDTSLQNEASQRFNQVQGQGFKTNNFNQIDRNLNNDFENFQNTRNYQENQIRLQQHMFSRMQHEQQQNIGSGQQKWVQDFSQMSIGAQKNDWQAQFMQHRQQNQNQQHQSQQQQQHQQQHQHQDVNQFQRFVPMAPQIAPQVTPFNLSMRTDLSEPLTEHRELHEQELFNEQFDQLEKELQQTEGNIVSNDREKEEFAKTAQQVHSSMMSVTNEETSKKFQNSNFLNLMNRISKRSVELDGDKLVNTASRADIRDHLADPLRDEKQELREKSHLPNLRESGGIENSNPIIMQDLPKPIIRNLMNISENEGMRSHLPDPMSHIKDGALDGITDPLMAAKIISGNQIKDQHWLGVDGNDDDWLNMTEDAPVQYVPPVTSRRGKILNDLDQEMFDDYRHDDDYH